MSLQPNSTATARRNVPAWRAVHEAMQALASEDTLATRELLQARTGLSFDQIKEGVDKLISEGAIARVERGVYRLVLSFPPARPVSQTQLADGTVKVEIGDHVLTLTPQEARMLGQAMSGHAVTHAQVVGMAELQHQAGELRRLIAEAAPWRAAGER